MKRSVSILSLHLLLATFSVALAQPEIIFTFDEGTVIPGSVDPATPDSVRFYVLAAAGSPGARLGDTQVYINYNTDAFGSGVGASGHARVEMGRLVQGDLVPGIPLYAFQGERPVVDNNPSRLAVTTSYLFASSPESANALGTTPDTLLCLTIAIADPTKRAGLAFDALMNDQQFLSNNIDTFFPVTGTDVLDCITGVCGSTNTADLGLTKEVDQAVVELDQQVVFTVTLTNDGPSNATGITVTDQLPAALTFVSAAPSQGTYDDASGLWSAGDLANGASATLDITATVDVAAIVTNTATITASDQTDPIADNDAASADVSGRPVADLSLTKEVDLTSVDIGQQVVFTVTLTNDGPSEATGAEVTDQLPAGLTFVGSAPSQGTYDDASGLWSAGDLANGASATLDITATVDVTTTVTNTATVTASDQTDPNADNDAASADVAGSPVADLSIAKEVDLTSVDVGQQVVFTVTLTNDGPSDATGAEVTDQLPAGLTFVGSAPSQGTYDDASGLWSAGDLANGASATLDITATVDVTTTVTNTATVTASDQTDPNADNDAASADVAGSPVADLSIAKEVDLTSVDVGQQVVFTVTLTNDGPSDATGAEVTDQLPAGLTFVGSAPSQGTYDDASGLWSAGDLANGASATLEITATVDVTTTVTNTATVTASDQTDPNADNDAASADVTGSPVADLSLAKEVDLTSVDVGQQVVFTVTLTNDGPSDATGAEVTDQLPAGLTFVGATPSQGTYDDASGLWSAGDLANGASATLDITATVDVTTTVTNTATVTASDQTDPNADNDAASADVAGSPVADLSIAKEVDLTSVDVGQQVVFTVTLTNDGPSDATGAEVTDLLPAGLTFVGSAPSQGTYDDASGLWSAGDLANGASATLDITATVDVTTTVTNTATITASDQTDPNADNDAASADVTGSPVADLSLAKEVDLASVDVGQQVVFTVTLTNDGPSDATGAEVTDQLPAGLTFVGATPSQGTYDDASGLWSAGDLANGASATLDITATVDVTTTVTNTATVTASDQTDPNADNDAASADVTGSPVADLSIAKEVDLTSVDVGQQVVFTVTLTNDGPSDATGAEVTDQLPAGLTFAGAAPSQGTYDDASGLWSAGDLANGASATLDITATVDVTTTVTNTATVTASDQTDPNADNDAANADVTGSPVADLSIAKEVDLTSVDVGQQVVFTVTLTNDGPSDATGAEVTDLLPSGLTFVGATPSQGTYDDASGLWSAGDLANGASATLDITATVDVTTTVTNTATVTASDQPDPNADNDAASADVTGNPVADLSIAKEVDLTSVDVGQQVVFTVTLTNDGPSDATGAEVTDQLPAGLTFVGAAPSQGTYDDASGLWSAGDLANGASATLDITATVDVTTTVTNTATITASDQTDPNADNDAASADVTGSPVADLSLAKEVDLASVDVGQQVVFTVTLTNDGPSDATGAEVTDQLPAGLTFVGAAPSQGTYDDASGLWSAGDLASGASATLDITATVEVTTTVTNTATVTASDQPDPNADNDTASADVTGSPVADLSLAKEVDLASVDVGQQVVFTVTLTNDGPSDATGAEVTDLLPSGLTFVGATPSQGTYDDASGLWSAGDLANGASATLDITATVDVTTTVTNTATVTASDQPDPNADNDAASADVTGNPVADLSIAKEVDLTSVDVGQQVVFTVTLTNDGPSDATGAEVTDQLPAGLTFVGAAPSQGTYDDASGLWSAGDLANGASATLDITATVDVTTTVTNTATITASDQTDPNADNDAASADVTGSPVADLSLAKEVDLASVDVGQQVVFTVTLTNDGPSDATGAEVTDQLPAGLTFVGAAPSQGTYDDASGLWSAGDLASGASATLDITATVEVTTTVTNTATVTASDQPDPNADNDTASADVTGSPVADLSLAKEVDLASVDVGQQVVFTVTLTNDGPSNATGAEVTDQLPAGLTFVGAAPSQGTYDDASGLWSAGDLANGAGATLDIFATVDVTTTVTNTATVTASDQPDPNADNDTASADVAGSPVADLSLAKEVDLASVDVGQQVVFTVTLTNDGPSDATGAEVTDQLPAGLTFVGAAPSQGTYDDASGLWSAGDLANGASATLEITATVDVTTTVTNTATVTASDQPDPNADNDAASADVAGSPVADLSLAKEVDLASVEVGQQVVFTVTLTNDGPSDATGAEVTDQLPAGLTFVGAAPSQGTYDDASGLWSAGDLASGASATLEITATVDVTTTVTNTATVTASDQPDPNADNDAASADVAGSPVADLSLAKEVDLASVEVGQQVVFTVTLTNDGPSDATGAEVTDQLPAGLTFVGSAPSQGTYDDASGLWSAGDLANGASATLDITATVDVTTTVTNTATVTASDQPDPNADNDAASADVAGSPVADLSIAKEVDLASVDVGQQVVFTVTLTNDGPSDATGAEVTDQLPAGLTFVGAAPSQGTYDDASGLWSAGDLANGASATLEITATVDVTTTVTNTATVTASDQPDPNADNDAASADVAGSPVADLSLAKEVDLASVEVGQQVVFTVTLTNDGPSDATGAEVTDQLPAGLTFVGSAPSQGTYDDASGLWSAGDLANGASATLDITATVDVTTTVTNTATVTASDQPDPNADNDAASADVAGSPVADLSLAKEVDLASVDVGQQVVFTVTLTNDGPSNATGAEVTDQLPAGLTFVGAAPSQGTYDDASGLWSAGDLANGASATLDITATVDVTTTVTNTATVTASDQPDPNADNDAASATVTVITDGVADLSILKVDAADPVQAGTSLTYFISVTNAGPDAAANVVMTDRIPGKVTFASAHGDGWSCSFVGGNAVCTIPTLGVGDAAIIAVEVLVKPTSTGRVTNRVSVSSATVDPNPDNNATAERTTISADAGDPIADLEVAKVASQESVDVGQNVDFTITVGNNGPNAATEVSLSDSLPDGLTFVSAETAQGSYDAASGNWSVGILANGTSATLSVTATVSAPGTWTNVASIAGSGQQDNNPSNDSASADVVGVGAADLAVTKGVSAAFAIVGTDVTFSVALTNNGPNDATGVSLADALPSGLALLEANASDGTYDPDTGVWTVGTIANGGSAALELVTTVTEEGTQANTAIIIASDQRDPDADNNTAEASVVGVITGEADLSIEKIDVTDPVLAGEQLEYTITVANAGPRAASNVVMTDDIPGKVTFVDAFGEGWTCGLVADDVGCVLPLLPPGTTAVVSVIVSVKAKATGRITNKVSVTSDSPDPAPENNSAAERTMIDEASTTANADLSLAKIVDHGTASIGEQVVFTITLENAGPADATGVEVTDLLPAGITFAGASASQGTYNDSSGIWSAGDLANGASATLAITATVASSAPIMNTASITAADQPDPNAANNVAQVEVNGDTAADLSVTSADTPDPVGQGAVLTYVLTVANAGPNAAQNVQVADQIAGKVTYVTASGDGWTCALAEPVVTCSLPMLPPGAESSVLIEVTVNPTATGRITNRVSVVSDTVDPNTDNNDVQERTTIDPALARASADLAEQLNAATDVRDLPDTFGLEGNYPNPFNPSTTIAFAVPETAPVTIAVYDMLGRQLRMLTNGVLDAGHHEVVFSADDLSSGVYLVTMDYPGGRVVRNIVLMK